MVGKTHRNHHGIPEGCRRVSEWLKMCHFCPVGFWTLHRELERDWAVHEISPQGAGLAKVAECKMKKKLRQKC